MKKTAIALVLTVVAGLAAATASAQANFAMRANVPFAFSVSGRDYAAGTYMLQAKNSGAMILRNQKTGQSGIVPLLNPERSNATAHLQFSRDGMHSTLRALTDAEGHTWRVPAPRTKLEIESKAAAESTTVVVALK
ncbi:MAG: hypothetical protein JO041_02005 [Acidobacteria bacterium]|nr:hypothetical protein [Acidobacteriota bacterium]